MEIRPNYKQSKTGNYKILPKTKVTVAQTQVLNTIEDDSDAIAKVVLSARNGNWTEVWGILGSPDNPRKSFYINCIPETRRWGILHQAVWWNKKDILLKLLNFSSCDNSVLAKESKCEKGDAGGKTPFDIAKDFNYTEMANILESHMCVILDQEMETFQIYRPNIENKYLGLFRLTLASYKKAFHPNKADPSKSLSAVIEDVFHDMNMSETRWETIRDTVADSIRFVNEDCNAAIEKLQGCTTREDFYEVVINTYTVEENYLYAILNTALRRQREENYRPTASDLALGPYVLVYQMLLMHWDQLASESAKTYRKMKIHAHDLERYKVGTKFVWLSFVSSSVELQNAQPFPTCGPPGDLKVLFIIDNSASSAWKPRNIEQFAQFKEKERVYPAGATFKVTNVVKAVGNGETTIHLTLC